MKEEIEGICKSRCYVGMEEQIKRKEEGRYG
jgi:hypothetical protein